MFQIAAAQLAAHVGLPVSAVGMTTGSHEPDWQACTQNALAALSTMAAGADLTAGAGTLGGGSVFSAQQLVMDSEIYSWNARLVAGVMVDDETIALDAIKQVGIGGNFLGQRHTRRHMQGRVAAAAARPQHVGCLGRVRQGGRLREGDAAGRQAPRRAPGAAARRRSHGDAGPHRRRGRLRAVQEHAAGPAHAAEGLPDARRAEHTTSDSGASREGDRR